MVTAEKDQGQRTSCSCPGLHQQPALTHSTPARPPNSGPVLCLDPVIPVLLGLLPLNICSPDTSPLEGGSPPCASLSPDPLLTTHSRAGHWPSLGLGVSGLGDQRESLRFFPTSRNMVHVLRELLPHLGLASPPPHTHRPTDPDVRWCSQQELDVLMRSLDKHDMAICTHF